jgi:CRISPR-associated protein Csm3
MRKTGFHEITGTIRLISGLRVGGSDEMLQIGGADLTCLKNPETLDPYIPGSSIKGKMRSEMEAKYGKYSANGTEPCNCAKVDCMVCVVFGPHKNAQHGLGPTRIIVRDAMLQKGGLLERKAGTAINRQSGAALGKSLRTEERVVANSEFRLKIAIQVWDMDDDSRLVSFVKEALRCVKETGLGSGISKGSGEIDLLDLKLDSSSFSL